MVLEIIFGETRDKYPMNKTLITNTPTLSWVTTTHEK